MSGLLIPVGSVRGLVVEEEEDGSNVEPTCAEDAAASVERAGTNALELLLMLLLPAAPNVLLTFLMVPGRGWLNVEEDAEGEGEGWGGGATLLLPPLPPLSHGFGGDAAMIGDSTMRESIRSHNYPPSSSDEAQV